MNNHRFETIVERSLLRLCLFLGIMLGIALFGTTVVMGVEICQPIMSQAAQVCDTLVLTGMIAFGISCVAFCILACLGALLMVLAAHIDERRAASAERYAQAWDGYLGLLIVGIAPYNPFAGEYGTPLPEVSVLDMVDEEAEFFHLLRVKTPVLPENRTCQGIGCGNPDCLNHDSFREEFDPFLGWGHVLAEVAGPPDEYAPRSATLPDGSAYVCPGIGCMDSECWCHTPYYDEAFDPTQGWQAVQEDAYRHEQEAVYGCIFSEDE